MKRKIIIFAILASGVWHSASAAPLSGTKSVGPAGDYASLTAAIADVQAGGNGLGGALVLELQAAYVSTVETYPLTIPALNGASAVNTLTIRPASDAAGLVISSADTIAATVDLNGAQFLTIDGRPGGAGTAKELTIENTSTSGRALRFINEASGNTIQYTTLRGVNLTSASGVVVFSTTTGANGNDDNTIDHCDIGDGANTPANGLYALGTTTTTAQNNNGNTISNCNVFNFYAIGGVTATGVQIAGGNTDWTLTGNSFYQTAGRTGVNASVRAIHVNNTSGNNFTVSGNFIGGSAPSAGGTAWTTTGTFATYRFIGIHINVGTTTPSSVQGNTIQNIVWTSSSATTTLPGVWCGIYVQAGSANIGTVTGNTIGSSTGTGSISVTTSGTGGTSFGIGSASSGTVVIANNAIGSITTNGQNSTISTSLVGIQTTNGTSTISNNTISNNTIGSTTSANSLNAATSSNSATSQQVAGILTSSTNSATITGNTVANLNNNYVGTASTGHIRGVVASSGVNIITGNTIRNLSTTSRNTGTTTSASVLGIILTSTAEGQNLSQNTVHSLDSTATSAGISVTGIYFTGLTTSLNVIARNLVHSLAISSSSASSALNGIYFATGSFTAHNNMVRLGLDASANSTAAASSVRGIFDNGTTGTRRFYHNSIYIGGTQNSGANNTFAFTSSGVTNTRTFQNNIFVNARSNSGGTGKHYAAQYGGTSGLTARGNIFLASGTGGVLGSFNSADHSTLAEWQTATGQDATSAVVDPLFVNATGDATAGDLHLQPSNPVEGQGVLVAAVTDDFDGQTRSSLTPTDVGADAGNFIWIDGTPPAISYPLLTSGSTANRVLTGWATITDAVGVASGADAPRIYFKKSADADVFGVANDSTGNGWKYAAATGSGPYSFTIDYSIINGGSVTIGDTIQYFVVAQDDANNLVSSPAFATASATPPVQNVSGHGAVNSFSIVSLFSNSTVTVGSGSDYPNLSGTDGLFAALNAAVLVGNLVVNVTSDLTETGGVTLNEFNATEHPATGNYTMTIQPDSATTRTISGSVYGGLITLNGADRVTIDGRFGGSGRYLTFRNLDTGTSASTILFTNDASSNTVRNCGVEGAGAGTGVISFSTGTVTGNDNNLITGCQVRDLSIADGVPYYLIASTSSSAAAENSGNTVSNNDLFNFNNIGIYIFSFLTGNESWTLSGNNIYEVNAATSNNYAIYMQSGGSNVITGNFIHDLLTTGTQSYGIYCSGINGTTTIAGNRITALNVSASTTTVYGIHARGYHVPTINVVNNQITLSPTASSSTRLIGLHDYGYFDTVVNVFYNSIVIGGTESGTDSSFATLREGSNDSSAHTARDNVFLNLRNGGSGVHFAAANSASKGSFTVSNNVYAGNGEAEEIFIVFHGTNGGGTYDAVNFAEWQNSTGDANSQAGIGGSGNFTSAMFVNTATGDLHLVPGGNALVNNTGTPIAGVTDDYDGDPRPASAPSIGSDQVPFADIVVSQTSALTDGISSVDLGAVNIGSTSAALTFTIANAGTADLTGLAVSKDGADAADFTVSALSSTSVAAGPGSATFTVTFTPGAGGARSAAIHIASNVTGTKNPFDIALSGTGLITQEMWRQTWFGTTVNNGNAADLFDFDKDGLVNLLEFAFGLNPTQNSAGQLPQGQTIGGSFVISFTQPAEVTGITYGAEWSTNLSSNPADWTAIPDTGTGNDHIFSVPIGGNTKLFVRLKVTGP